MPKAVSAAMVVGVMLLVGTLGSGCSSGAADPSCERAVASVVQEIGAGALSGAASAHLLAEAAAKNPSCARAIAAVGPEIAEAADPILRARGFLGPIGWYWNNIYFRVFAGSTPNMVLFGVPLFFAPLVLIGSLFAVLSGTRGARRKPVVPDAIRTKVN